MQRGFSLVELMVALAVGSFLLAGIAMSYTAIKSTVLTTQQLANAQEVLRYTNQILSRSIKQTFEAPVVSGNGLILEVKQNANSPSCQGSVPTIEYKEVYTLSNGYITCDIVNNDTGESLGSLNLLRGVEALQFGSSRSGRLIDVTVTPVNVPTQFANGIVISLAATRVIMR
ncbi:prepilin-type N-terminal cleavage/methylation domain-containing protein [Pseudoalteromonas sp. JBTF-M23]|uniref:Prepilin-type N-terminal cleavage/methylation domain-containing protein n=1 Tax=Pseudoalteromonas caenipelagi TaxID=2726988 RepID=A0A849VHC4_9GAMM|nr:prepilin-type N-terminal cleavage/methylation domain-containing protein [Pseudoalteromonas caenipelagi]NOU53169.1 prepilin-type N-terminal cleavage/methylation domain-containing protein [Pseudoalteromonas caenipelagi]